MNNTRALSIVMTIASLTTADLERLGALGQIQSQAPSVEIEDTEYEAESLEIDGDRFECIAVTFFTCDHGQGNTISDDMVAQVKGHFDGDTAVIDSFTYQLDTDHIVTAATLAA